jgi:LytS/YehU family sensor histidine kinase
VVHGRASFTDLAWYWNILIGLLMMGANAGIKLIFNSMQNEQKIIALERQSLKAEMDYLKYQINPHFFMNTLNNIHALIDFDTKAAQETVIELSKMMRYVLYDSEKNEVGVAQELEFVNNYIKLMRIRYTDNVDVRVNVQSPMPINAKVPPLVFIVLVENAFKHGVSYNKPSFVYIDVTFGERTITICVENSRFEKIGGERQASGMGLENISKRLSLMFGDNYKLNIDDSQSDKYCVELTIPLKYD